MNVYVQDLLADAGGTTLQAHAPSGFGQTGATWTRHPAGACDCVFSAGGYWPGSLRVGAANTQATYTASGTPASGDYDVTASFAFTNANNCFQAITGRYSTTQDNGYAVLWNGNLWQLYRIDAGSGTKLGSDSPTYPSTAGTEAVVTLRFRGTSITVLVNGVSAISATDATYTTGKAGIRMYGTANDANGPQLRFFTAVDAVPAQQTISVTDPCTYWSPGAWDSDGIGARQANELKSGSTYAITANTGNYTKLSFSPPYGFPSWLKVTLDTSMLAGITAANCPTLAISVDGGTFSDYLLSYSASPVTLLIGTGLHRFNGANGVHTAEIYFKSIDLSSDTSGGNRWNEPSTHPGSGFVKITGFQIEGDAVPTTPPIRPNKMLSFWSSRGEGADVLGTGYANAVNDATLSSIRPVAIALDCEYGCVSWASQGYEQPGNGNVPRLLDAYSLYYSGRPRDFGGLDYIVDFHGRNGTVTASDVQTMLTNYRAASPSAKILLVQEIDQVSVAQKATGFAAYQAACPTDTNVYLVDCGVNYLTGRNSSDGVHGNYRAYMEFAAAVGAKCAPITIDRADVRNGVWYGPGLRGACAVPARADTRLGTAVDNTTGTLAVGEVVG